MKKILFILSIFLISSKVPAQEVTLIDSLLRITKHHKNDSVVMQAYNKLRRATYYSDIEESKKYTKKFLEYARKRNDSLHIAFAHFYLGNSYVQSNDLTSAIAQYLKASDYYERVKDSVRLPSVLNAIGAVYEKKLDDSLSLRYYEKSLQLSQAANDKRRSSIALINISNIFQKQGNYSVAIEKLEEAIRLIEAHKNVDNKTNVKQQEQIAKINLATAYLEVQNLEKAKDIFSELLNTVDTIKNKYVYNYSLVGLGKVNLRENNNEVGTTYLEKAYKSYTANNFEEDRYLIMMDLIDAYNSTNQEEKALRIFYEYNTIKDSIFNVDKDKNLADMLQKYEAEKKDNEILAQSLTIEKKNKQKNRILIGLIALGILSIIGFLFLRKRHQYKSKLARQKQEIQKQKITDLQQKNKLLAMSSMIKGQEAERLRIAKDLHDSLGGLLSTVKAHFTTIQNKIKQLEDLNITGKTNQLIDEACVEVRRISHNMMPHALSISGLKGAVEDVGAHLTAQGYKTTVEIKNLPSKIETTREVMVYRLIQEIVSNIRKHAEAKSILIQLIGFKNDLNLTIEDDGKGFEYKAAIAKGGLGLKSIDSRVQFLDGTIDWDTQTNRGTSLTITIPVV
ncbi:tetratricopeptide repeat protein [Jejudonia soesokkakensis]|uniref:histidine kinase n=1 Tax=Jejudonia soesokkakensis TaxID=1323432 RepID=A0ABW2MXN1_9FLAO